MVATAVQQGIWKLEQDNATKTVYLYRYSEVIDHWQEDKLLTWEQMYDMLLRESYKRRGEN